MIIGRRRSIARWRPGGHWACSLMGMIGPADSATSSFVIPSVIPPPLPLEPLRHRRVRRLVRRFINHRAPGFLFRPFPPFRAKRVTGQFLRTELIRKVLPQREPDRIEFSSTLAPWIPDDETVNPRPSDTTGNGQLRLEESQLEGEILRRQHRLDGLLERIDRAQRELDAVPTPTHSQMQGPTSFTIDLAMLPVSNRTGRSSMVGGSPLVIRPIVKEYPGPSGQLIDILL